MITLRNIPASMNDALYQTILLFEENGNAKLLPYISGPKNKPGKPTIGAGFDLESHLKLVL